MSDTTPAIKYQCRHIFTDGRRCASPCLRQEEFCYYHHTTRKPVENPRQRRSRRSTFNLPLPEDRSSIQQSIGEVLQRIASNDIDPRRAGLLLYGLQIASINLPKPKPVTQSTRRNSDEPTEEQTVEEITTDPTLGILAPRTEIAEPEEHLSTVGRLLRKMALSERCSDEPTTQPNVIPTLNAESNVVSQEHPGTGCPTSRIWDVGFRSALTIPTTDSHPQRRMRHKIPNHSKTRLPHVPHLGRGFSEEPDFHACHKNQTGRARLRRAVKTPRRRRHRSAEGSHLGRFHNRQHRHKPTGQPLVS